MGVPCISSLGVEEPRACVPTMRTKDYCKTGAARAGDDLPVRLGPHRAALEQYYDSVSIHHLLGELIWTARLLGANLIVS